MPARSRSEDVRENQIPLFVDCETARIGKHRELCQQLACTIEFLHAVIQVIGHENIVAGVNRKINRKMELTRLVSLLTPGFQERGCLRFFTLSV